jgi:hypothetical protein
MLIVDDKVPHHSIWLRASACPPRHAAALAVTAASAAPARVQASRVLQHRKLSPTAAWVFHRRACIARHSRFLSSRRRE